MRLQKQINRSFVFSCVLLCIALSCAKRHCTVLFYFLFMLRLVINLNSAKTRWKNIQSQLKTLDITAQRLPAIDAKKDALPLNKVAPLGHPAKYFFPRELTTGEIACYLSHMKCWETLLESDEQWAAILEDDALLSTRAKNFLESTQWIPPNIHILQLHTFEKRWLCRTAKTIPLTNGSTLYNVITQSYGACCYLIDRQAAKEALALSRLLAAPVDEFLFNFKSPFTKRYPTMRINPCCVYHNTHATSIIGHDRFSHKNAYSLRNHLSLKRLYLSTKKNFIKKFFCVDTVFTWE